MGDEWSASMLHLFSVNGLINSEDSGLLHLAALTMSDVKGERLLGVGEIYTHDKLIDAMARVDPSRKLPAKLGSAEGVARATVDMERSFELTARLGKAKWTNLDESVRQNATSMTPLGAKESG